MLPSFAPKKGRTKEGRRSDAGEPASLTGGPDLPANALTVGASGFGGLLASGTSYMRRCLCLTREVPSRPPDRATGRRVQRAFDLSSPATQPLDDPLGRPDRCLSAFVYGSRESHCICRSIPPDVTNLLSFRDDSVTLIPYTS